MSDSKLPPREKQSTDEALADLLEQAYRRGGVDPGVELDAMRERAARAAELAQKRAEARKNQRSATRYREELARAAELGTSQKMEGGASVSGEVPRDGRLRRAPKPRKSRRDFGAEWSDKLRQVGHVGAVVPVSRRAFVGGDLVHADATGRRARWALAELPRHYARAVLRAVKRGLGELDYAHVWARKVVALATMVHRLSVRSRRRGFGRVCRGIGRGLFAAAMRNPQTGESYTIGALFGWNEERRIAPAAALAESGAWLVIQPPADVAGPEELGPSGWAYNQYWLPSAGAEAPESDAEAAELAALGVGTDPSPVATAPPS